MKPLQTLSRKSCQQHKLTSIVDYVCLLWVGDNDRDQITCSYVVMAKDLKCFLGLTVILAQQPLQILQASCAHQETIVGAVFTCLLQCYTNLRL